MIQPSQNALTNNSAPPITFGYDATCSGKPCGFAPAYYSSYSLTALLNNQPIGNLFKFDSVLGQANYTPASRLPEGQNTLTAQAKDSFGHISNSVTNTFTIDTIPPKFLTVTPAEGTVFTTPLVTIQGQ